MRASSPYLSQRNVHIVPVLRHRLTFAVQVRRAVHELELGDDDLIAVALPESARPTLTEAIGRFPRVSVLVCSLGGHGHEEVLPVTPADGLVEAVRAGVEQGIPVRFIDLELAPGSMSGRVCVEDDWPDDALALEYGAQHYLDLISDRLGHPPSRHEPVDSWRELHLAGQLQALAGRHRNILVVCDATHVHGVQRLVGQPAPLLDIAQPLAAPLRYRVMTPNLAVLMHYLDDVPRLVEAYERQRARGTAHLFDKRTALIRLLHELSDGSPDLTVSIRHYQAFAQVLNRLLEIEQRVSPDFDTVLRACHACFPTVFRERVFRHLLGYFDQVKTERIGRIRGSRDELFETSTPLPRNSHSLYVARNCTLTHNMFEVIRPPAEREPGNDVLTEAPDVPLGQVLELEPPPPRRPATADGDEWSETWPPADQFQNEMRRKAFTISRVSGGRRVKSLEFNGSLHDGMDFRRTLRSYFKAQPQLYVRQQVRRRAEALDGHEPVVWLFDGYDTVELSDPGYESSQALCGYQGEQRAVEWFVLGRPASTVDLEDQAGKKVTIRSQTSYARICFMDWDFTRTTDEMLQRLGDQLDQRVPTYEDSEEILDKDRLSEPTFGFWWDALLAATARYALRSVVLVAPQKFVVPDAVNRHFAAAGKSIARIPITSYSTEELRRLRIQYWLAHPYKPLGEGSDPQHLEFVTRQFEHLMKRFVS